MRGFLYTLIVLVLAVSFMYVLTIQNSLQEMGANDYTLQGLKHSYNALYGIRTGESEISGETGRAIRIGDYKAIIENYNAVRNADVKIELAPDFTCGDTRMGFSGFGGGAWNTELKHATTLSASSAGNAIVVSKEWQWADNGVLLMLKVTDAGGTVVFDGQGYVNETLNNAIHITDEGGNMFTVALSNGVLTIDGKGKFTEKIGVKCNVQNTGYIEKGGIRYRI